jgi:hypothetical protein
MLDGLRGNGTGGRQLGEGPITDRLASVGQEPADGNSVIIREIQDRPPV